ncbi:MAG: hypothetical protein IT422_03120 [Pirellulaceae bacterium]|nr:hypothetical protein [Pirellulaceae bacterium]
MADVKEKEFLNSLEATKYLGITWYRLRRMTEAGALKRVPGTKWYVKADLDRLLKGGGQNADSKGSD